ncbi:hypothetical protein ED733_003653 [Metarhizium rileyi]|uniref:Uncharacterized protein n=1 Tax=Metarhizium rileyi (strain RCEF 4871) TaxID=1649241 RepID=A0A5C6GAT1_METRR|nr:hypothetical protein ED733_003653 [Metarhizium rileyi]
MTTSLILKNTPKPALPALENATVAHFAWSDIIEETHVDPEILLSRPNSDKTPIYACPEGAGPNAEDCPHTIEEWTHTVDGKGEVSIDKRSCTSVTKACCQAVVCAPSNNSVHLGTGDVTGRMWSPLTIRCILQGRGGVWIDGVGSLYIQMLRPRNDRCLA